jgi:hypothetical protein
LICTPPLADLETLVVEGMQRRPRQLPAWLLYDAEGSRLFEAICEQPEYSLTRTEVQLLETSGACDQPAPSAAAIHTGEAPAPGGAGVRGRQCPQGEPPAARP